MDQPYLKTRCPGCATTFRVRSQFIPEAGARTRCRVCGHAFVIRGSEPRSQIVWLFADDPAFQRPQTMHALEQCSTCHLEVLDAEARSALAALPRLDLPAAVVFGDMHVILEEELLRRCAEAGTVQRVLVSTHKNDDMVDSARAFCGFDHHLTLPVDAALVRAVLQDAVNTTTTLA